VTEECDNGGFRSHSSNLSLDNSLPSFQEYAPWTVLPAYYFLGFNCQTRSVCSEYLLDLLFRTRLQCLKFFRS